MKALSSGIVEKYTVNRRSSEGQLVKVEISAVVKKGGLYQALEATKISKRGVDGKALGNAIGQEIAREATFVDIYTRIIGEYLPNAISVEIPEGCTEIVDKEAVAIRVSVKVSSNRQAKASFKERFELLLDQAATGKQRLSVSHVLHGTDRSGITLSRVWFGDTGREGEVHATSGAKRFPFITESLRGGIMPGAITCSKSSLLGKEAIAFAQCEDGYEYFEPKNGSDNPLAQPSVTIVDDDGEDGTIYFLSDSMYKRAISARKSANVAYVILVQAVDENNVKIGSARIGQSGQKGEDRIYLCGNDFKTLSPGFALPTRGAPRFLPLGSLQVCTTLQIAPADLPRLHAFQASVISSAQ